MTIEQTSSIPGATPENGLPVTGTPASIGATPEKSNASLLEEANRRIAELEKKQSNSTEELERHRKNAKKLSEYEKAEQERQQAALSDVEKANVRATEAEQKIQHYQQQLVTTQVELAAQRMGIINPALAALAIANKLDTGEDGLPTNIETALKELIKDNPYLVAKAEAPATSPELHTTPQQQQAPAIPAMNPGRSNLTAPGTLPSGKAMKLTDVQWSR
jgi:multidrug efflux pump subunit AcrA (membrane-fusion protein)